MPGSGVRVSPQLLLPPKQNAPPGHQGGAFFGRKRREQGVEPARPLTHDLIRDLIAALGHSLKEVRIVDLQEGTFYADLIFDRDIKVSARPSDSVAIALRVGVPIYVEEAVLAEAGLLIPDDNDEEAAGAVREDEVEKFKEFLDSVSPDDFKAT